MDNSLNPEKTAFVQIEPKLTFEEIVEKYKENLYWHIRKIVLVHDDANDVLQNTFLKVWKGLDNFKGESKLYTWLYRIATNESINFLNKRKNNFDNTSFSNESALYDNLKADEYFDGDKLQLEFQKALLTLPTKQRLIFNMKYFDDMKYSEISDILGTSVGALKASYFHAVKKIESYIKESTDTI